jgi:centriolar protein POC1
VRKAQFSFDSRLIASASDDKTVKLWDVNQNADLIHTFTDHTGMVSDVKFHPDGTCLASCGSDKKIKIFDVRSHRLL